MEIHSVFVEGEFGSLTNLKMLGLTSGGGDFRPPMRS